MDQDKLKVDARVGLRYRHLGQNLSFQRSGIFSNSSQSANWVDAVARGKFEGVLTPKLLVTFLGYAGGGGANLDYEVARLALKVSQRVLAGRLALPQCEPRYECISLVRLRCPSVGGAGVTIRLK